MMNGNNEIAHRAGGADQSLEAIDNLAALILDGRDFADLPLERILACCFEIKSDKWGFGPGFSVHNGG
jgi:hypothetical protein